MLLLDLFPVQEFNISKISRNFVHGEWSTVGMQ